MRADPYLKSMLLGLIEDSYLHTGTLTQFAAEVLQVIAYAVTVPVAFTEGFLRAYLSIERVVEDDDGRIKIIPKAGASIEDMIRDVDEITAQVDPGAVFNPVVRSKLDAVHQTSSKAMKWDLNALSRMDDGQLMDVLRQMQAESERIADEGPSPATATATARPPTTCAHAWPPSGATCASSRRSAPSRTRRGARRRRARRRRSGHGLSGRRRSSEGRGAAPHTVPGAPCDTLARGGALLRQTCGGRPRPPQRGVRRA